MPGTDNYRWRALYDLATDHSLREDRSDNPFADAEDIYNQIPLEDLKDYEKALEGMRDFDPVNSLMAGMLTLDGRLQVLRGVIKSKTEAKK